MKIKKLAHDAFGRMSVVMIDGEVFVHHTMLDDPPLGGSRAICCHACGRLSYESQTISELDQLGWKIETGSVLCPDCNLKDRGQT